MSLKAKIQQEIKKFEKRIDELEDAHREKMREARQILANWRKMLKDYEAEGIES